MSEENVELVRQIYATGCWNGDGEPEAAFQYLDEDFEFNNPSHAVLPAPRYGHDGFAKAMRSPSEGFEHWHHEPLRFQDCGDKVLVDIVLSARGQASGIEFERPEWHVWTLSDGKAVRVAWTDSEAEASWLAHLSDSPGRAS